MSTSTPATPPFSMLPYMRKRYASENRSLGFDATTPAEWRKWRSKTVRKLRELIGINTMQDCPIKPHETRTEDCGDHLRTRVELTTEPDVVMPIYVLTPKDKPLGVPVIACHGHGGGGKAAVAGVRDEPEIAQAIKTFNYDFGVQAVREGFTVFCADARGFGERREKNVPLLGASCQAINHMAIPLGQTVTGMWVHDLQRLADYIATRDDVDSNRLGCIGLSGGGLQTLWTTALDTRIKACVVSGYFYGVRESLLDLYTNCSCNYVPRLWEHVDMGDLGALIADRAMMVETGDEDPLNGASNLKNVKRQLTITRKAFKVHDNAASLKHHIFHGPHQWDGEKAMPFLKKHLLA